MLYIIVSLLALISIQLYRIAYRLQKSTLQQHPLFDEKTINSHYCRYSQKKSLLQHPFEKTHLPEKDLRDICTEWVLAMHSGHVYEYMIEANAQVLNGKSLEKARREYEQKELGIFERGILEEVDKLYGEAKKRKDEGVLREN